MKVLAIISDRTVPTVTATRVRNQYLWPKLKSLGVDVKLVGINLDRSETNPQGPPKIDCHLVSHKRANILKRLQFSLTKSFHEWPRSEELVQLVKSIDQEWRPDIIHAEEMRMAYYLPCLQSYQTMAKQSVTFHNVETELIKKTGSSPFKIGKSVIESFHQSSLEKYEKKVAQNVDLAFAFSKVDFKKYQAKYPKGKWDTTENGTNASDLQVKPQISTPNILIVGSLSYAPNINGINWFLENILPKLPKNYKVTIAGSKASEEYKIFLKNHPIDFVDTPDTLIPFFQQCALCAVPLFEGSGTRGKILESLANERLIVTTPIGAEGLGLSEEQGVILANSESDFLAKLIKWTEDTDERKIRAACGRQQVLEKYDWQVVASNLISKWEKLITAQ